jgi:hypothetical protein
MEKAPREWLAFYRNSGEWRLITRELSTEKHATKMAEQYRDHGYQAKAVSVYLLLKCP